MEIQFRAMAARQRARWNRAGHVQAAVQRLRRPVLLCAATGCCLETKAAMWVILWGKPAAPPPARSMLAGFVLMMRQRFQHPHAPKIVDTLDAADTVYVVEHQPWGVLASAFVMRTTSAPTAPA